MSRQKNETNSAATTATIRLIFLGIVLLLQIALMAVLSFYLQNLSVLITIPLRILSTVIAIYVYNFHTNPSTRLFWLILIILFPTFGLLLYFLWGRPRRTGKKYWLDQVSRAAATAALQTYAEENKSSSTEGRLALYQEHPPLKPISTYLETYGFPVFGNTRITYFSCGEDLFDDCLSALKQAKKTIFMAFFILKEGRLWDQFYQILAAKAKQGLEVRLLLDDAGTMFNLSPAFIEGLRKDGILVELFNPTHRYLNSLYLNYRNHQKIIVIDHNIGYTGGVNLSDEYANYTSPYGYWKDTGIRLDGQGVYGLTVAFLDSWDQTVGRLTQSYLQYCPQVQESEEGFCQVVSDGPGNDPHNPAEGLIFRMLESAQDYIYLTTPYLAISSSLIDTICRVAQSGVKVKILVPYIVDHWYVYVVTKSNFPALIKAGVEIYRFTPGMLHAKMIVSDDAHALVGTINLDNRSFYSQYEDGVWFCGKPSVLAVKEDIEKTIEISYQVTAEDCKKTGLFSDLPGLLFRLFSPLM